MEADEKKALDEAIQMLRVIKVNIYSSSVEVHDSEQLERLEEEEMVIQAYHGCKKVDEVQGNNADGEPVFNYIYYFEAGVRIISKEDDDELEKNKDHNANPLFSITTVFKAHYFSKEKLSAEATKAFAQKNAGFNVWPYWREYVQSTCCRVGIEPIPIPLYKC